MPKYDEKYDDIDEPIYESSRYRKDDLANIQKHRRNKALTVLFIISLVILVALAIFFVLLFALNGKNLFHHDKHDNNGSSDPGSGDLIPEPFKPDDSVSDPPKRPDYDALPDDFNEKLTLDVGTGTYQDKDNAEFSVSFVDPDSADDDQDVIVGDLVRSSGTGATGGHKVFGGFDATVGEQKAMVGDYLEDSGVPHRFVVATKEIKVSFDDGSSKIYDRDLTDAELAELERGTLDGEQVTSITVQESDTLNTTIPLDLEDGSKYQDFIEDYKNAHDMIDVDAQGKIHLKYNESQISYRDNKGKEVDILSIDPYNVKTELSKLDTIITVGDKEYIVTGDLKNSIIEEYTSDLIVQKTVDPTLCDENGNPLVIGLDDYEYNTETVKLQLKEGFIKSVDVYGKDKSGAAMHLNEYQVEKINYNDAKITELIKSGLPGSTKVDIRVTDSNGNPYDPDIGSYVLGEDSKWGLDKSLEGKVNIDQVAPDGSAKKLDITGYSSWEILNDKCRNDDVAQSIISGNYDKYSTWSDEMTAYAQKMFANPSKYTNDSFDERRLYDDYEGCVDSYDLLQSAYDRKHEEQLDLLRNLHTKSDGTFDEAGYNDDLKELEERNNLYAQRVSLGSGAKAMQIDASHQAFEDIVSHPLTEEQSEIAHLAAQQQVLVSASQQILQKGYFVPTQSDCTILGNYFTAGEKLPEAALFDIAHVVDSQLDEHRAAMIENIKDGTISYSDIGTAQILRNISSRDTADLIRDAASNHDGIDANSAHFNEIFQEEMQEEIEAWEQRFERKDGKTFVVMSKEEAIQLGLPYTDYTGSDSSNTREVVVSRSSIGDMLTEKFDTGSDLIAMYNPNPKMLLPCLADQFYDNKYGLYDKLSKQGISDQQLQGLLDAQVSAAAAA